MPFIDVGTKRIAFRIFFLLFHISQSWTSNRLRPKCLDSGRLRLCNSDYVSGTLFYGNLLPDVAAISLLFSLRFWARRGAAIRRRSTTAPLPSALQHAASFGEGMNCSSRSLRVADPDPFFFSGLG